MSDETNDDHRVPKDGIMTSPIPTREERDELREWCARHAHAFPIAAQMVAVVDALDAVEAERAQLRDTLDYMVGVWRDGAHDFSVLIDEVAAALGSEGGNQ